MNKIALSLAIGTSLFGTILFSPVALSQSATKTEQIQELLEVTGSGELGIQVMENMLDQMRLSTPSVPPEWWDKFAAKVNPEDLNNLVVPIYDKHFTDEEITAMLEFYKTPVGQSVVSKLPIVTQESMTAGQIWGTQLATEVIQELQRDGYVFPDNKK